MSIGFGEIPQIAEFLDKDALLSRHKAQQFVVDEEYL
jgi:hypothetical protein